MSLTISANSARSYEPIAEGTHVAICFGLIDIGLQYNEKYKNSAEKVIILWELPDQQIEIDGKLQPRIFSKEYTASLREKAILLRDLNAWRGRSFTEEELEAFDLRDVLGVPCFIQINHTERNGKKYANMASIMSLPKGVQRPVGTMEQISFDMDTSPLSEIEKLPKWIQDKIRNSETYLARVGAQNEEAEFTELDDDDGELPF